MMFVIKPGPQNRKGFTLIEIVISIAIVAIMAGAIAPLAFKELVRSREEATQKELDNLNTALVHFYEDTGRFPLENEGLAALVIDPGRSWKVSSWSCTNCIRGSGHITPIMI